MNIAKAGNPHKEPGEWRCHRDDRKRNQGRVTGQEDIVVLEVLWRDNKKCKRLGISSVRKWKGLVEFDV